MAEAKENIFDETRDRLREWGKFFGSIKSPTPARGASWADRLNGEVEYFRTGDITGFVPDDVKEVEEAILKMVREDQNHGFVYKRTLEIRFILFPSIDEPYDFLADIARCSRSTFYRREAEAVKRVHFTLCRCSSDGK